VAVSKGAWAALKADFRANAPNLSERPRPDEFVRAFTRNVPTVRFAAVALLRFSQAVGRRLPLGGSVLKQLNHVLTGCDSPSRPTLDQASSSTIRPASWSARTVGLARAHASCKA